MPNSGSVSSKRRNRTRVVCLCLCLLCWLSAACRPAVAPADAPARTLTVYSWVNYLPQPVIDAFTAETGIEIEYVTYETQDEAVAALRAGANYDLVVLSIEYIPDMIAGGYVAPIAAQQLSNRNNIPANFRDLAFDPGNLYAIPFHWGTTGLLVRTDLVDTLPSHWADLWDPRYGGKVAVWPLQAALLPIALKKLGYSVNSEDPEQIEQAIAALEELRAHSFWFGNENATIVPVLAEGKAVLAYGWAYDALLAQEEGLPIAYILPEEGSVLWADFWLIPATSRYPEEATLFLDFLLRPQIGAQLVAGSFYPVANDAALEHIDPALLANPVIFPPAEALAGAELTQPLSPAAQKLRNEAWNQFMRSGGGD